MCGGKHFIFIKFLKELSAAPNNRVADPLSKIPLNATRKKNCSYFLSCLQSTTAKVHKLCTSKHNVHIWKRSLLTRFKWVKLSSLGMATILRWNELFLQCRPTKIVQHRNKQSRRKRDKLRVPRKYNCLKYNTCKNIKQGVAESFGGISPQNNDRFTGKKHACKRFDDGGMFVVVVVFPEGLVWLGLGCRQFINSTFTR